MAVESPRNIIKGFAAATAVPAEKLEILFGHLQEMLKRMAETGNVKYTQKLLFHATDPAARRLTLLTSAAIAQMSYKIGDR